MRIQHMERDEKNKLVFMSLGSTHKGECNIYLSVNDPQGTHRQKCKIYTGVALMISQICCDYSHNLFFQFYFNNEL